MEPRYVMSEGGNLRRATKPARGVARRLRQAVYERDDFTCKHCAYRPTPDEINHAAVAWRWNGSPGRLTLDHVIPYRDGGEFTLQNLQTLCASCNGKKGATT